MDILGDPRFGTLVALTGVLVSAFGIYLSWRNSSVSNTSPTNSSLPSGYNQAASAIKPNWGLLLGVALVLVPVLCVVSYSAVAVLGSITKPNAPTPTLSSTVLPTPQVVFQDPLTTTSSAWPNDSVCGFRSDGYHITGNRICKPNIASIADADISVTVKEASGAIHTGYGIAVRWASEGDCFIFAIDSHEDWAMNRYVGGQGKNIRYYENVVGIRPGLNVYNTLLVRTRGSHFEFYVNGTLVGQADDAANPTGVPGLYGPGDGDIVFTDFKVAKPST
jgi:hypothetical protein